MSTTGPLTDREVRDPVADEAVKQLPEATREKAPTQKELEAIKQEEAKKRRMDKWSRLAEKGHTRLRKMVLEEMLKWAGIGEISISNTNYEALEKSFAQSLPPERKKVTISRAIFVIEADICTNAADLLQKQKEGRIYRDQPKGPEQHSAFERWIRCKEVIAIRANVNRYGPYFRAAISNEILACEKTRKYNLIGEYLCKSFKNDVLNAPELAELLKE